MSPTPALSVRDLVKTYDNGVHALRGLSLDVAAGDFFALLGPNGAGKSTLIGMIASLVNFGDEGEIEIFGLSVRHQRSQAMSQIGLVQQEINFKQFEMPVEILVYQAGFYGVPRAIALERAEKYLRALSLWDKRDAISRTLSGGMKRRLMIARAMMNEPRLLILDEPTAGVDIEIRRSMWQFVRQINDSGTTVILTTHYLEEAEQLCRNIAIIDHGRIIEHSPMRSLLAKLDVEAFVLDIDEGEHSLPAIDGVRLQRVDVGTLEAEVPKSTDLSEVFAALHRQGIRVKSMRNKANRLEELFMRLVEPSADGTGNGSAPPPPRRRCRSPAMTGRETWIALYTLWRREIAHRAHLVADPGAAGDHHDAVLPDLRQAHRRPHRPDGRHRLHRFHRAGPDHDERDHQQLRQHRLQLLLAPSSASTWRRCWCRRCPPG